MNEKMIGKILPGEEISVEISTGEYMLNAKAVPNPDILSKIFLITFISKCFPKISPVKPLSICENDHKDLYFIVYFDSPSFIEELKRFGQNIVRWVGIGRGAQSILLTEVSKAAFKNKRIDNSLHIDFKRKRPAETLEEKQLVLWSIGLGTLMLIFGVYVFNQPIKLIAKMGVVMFLAGLMPTIRLLSYIFNKHLIFRYKFLRIYSIIMVAYFILFSTQVSYYSQLFGISILFIVAYCYVFYRAKSVLKK